MPSGLPACMEMIEATDVIRAMEKYLRFDTVSPIPNNQKSLTLKQPHDTTTNKIPETRSAGEFPAEQTADGAQRRNPVAA